MELFINPLSANGQCQTVEESEGLIKGMYEIIRFCVVLIDSKNLVILYDPHLDSREIFSGQPFLQTINHVRPDVKRLWFIHKSKYTKSLNINAETDSICVQINESIKGDVHASLFFESNKWLSFRCASLSDALQKVACENISKNIVNFFDVDHIKKIVPIYQPNPKHRKTSYVSASGEEVSAMPKSDGEAQDLLFASKCISSSTDKWAYCKNSNEYYRFVKTHVDKEIYHGFISPVGDVPHEIKQRLDGMAYSY